MMRRRWELVGAALLLAVTATGCEMVASAQQTTPAPRVQPANTAKVQRGNLSAMVSVDGTLTYQARSDGSPYSVINQARGTYTALPEGGDTITCGDVLYRVDDQPVLLLCGPVPSYRDLRNGDAGNDVRQLNQNLHQMGYDARTGVALAADSNAFTSETEQALKALQQDKGLAVSGVLALGDAVVLPDGMRIAEVAGQLGGPAQPGAPVLSGTSDTPEVQVDLEPALQAEVNEGDSAKITLPGQQVITGKVARLGRVAQAPVAQNGRPGPATIPAFIALDDTATTSGLDRAPVRVSITTGGVENVLSVPVTALVGKAGGGFAVEVVSADGARELVTVKLGLFDTAGGRVQVEGDLTEGDQVVVPSL